VQFRLQAFFTAQDCLSYAKGSCIDPALTLPDERPGTVITDTGDLRIFLSGRCKPGAPGQGRFIYLLAPAGLEPAPMLFRHEDHSPFYP